MKTNTLLESIKIGSGISYYILLPMFAVVVALVIVVVYEVFWKGKK